MLKRTIYPALAVLTLSMVACGAPNTPQASTDTTKRTSVRAQSLTAASGTTLQTYQADLSATTTVVVAGLPTQVIQSPTGTKVAYLFNGNQVKTRLDVPGSQFPDQRARIALYDNQTATAQVVFADTNAADPSVNPAALVSLLQNATTFGAQAAPAPLTTQDAATFRSRMGAQNLTTTDSSMVRDGTTTSVVQASKTWSNPNGGTNAVTLNFDPQVGMVTRTSSRFTTPEGTQNSVTDITYDTVTNLSGVRLPTRLYTSAQLTAAGTGRAVSLTQDVNFVNAQVNTLSSTHFTLGGQ